MKRTFVFLPLTLVLAGFAAGEPSFCSLRCGPGSCEDENWPKVLDAVEACETIGLDVLTWCREGLVDRGRARKGECRMRLLAFAAQRML